MSRAATAGELTNMRADGQWSRLYLSIQNPAVVFKARVNQTFTTLDKIAAVTYDTVTAGAYTDIIAGQTVWFGTTEGAYDIGMARVRKTPTSTVLYIGETSELSLADNYYITVVDSFGLWPKHPVVKRDMSILMDRDVAYSAQHSAFNPVPILGPSAAVLWLTGATVAFQPTAANSWCYSAGTKTYLWTAPGASATSGTTTATPTITYNAAGTYRVSCRVTVGGVSTTGYRTVFVHSAASLPVTQFELNTCAGSYAGGGWTFDVTLYGEASTTTVIDRALVVLHSRDYVGTAAIASAGALSNTAYDGIVALGWIAGETIRMNPQNGNVTFAVRGPQYWLNQMYTGPASFTALRSTPTAWNEFSTMTVGKMLWHFAEWRSTCTAVLDVFQNTDTRRAAQVDTTVGPLWTQMTDVSSMILAQPCCNRYGQLYFDVDPQVTPAADRASWPTILTLQENDAAGDVTVTRLQHPNISRVELSGDVVTASLASGLVYSLANGHIYKRHGATLALDRLLLSSQTQANSLAGLVMARENARYTFDIQLAQNNKLLDVCPPQYVGMWNWTNDSPRALTYSGLTIPREINHQLASGALLTNVTLVAESVQDLAVNGDIPIDPDSTGQEPITIPETPPIELPPIPPFEIPDNTLQDLLVLFGGIPGGGIYYTPDINTDFVTWGPMDIGLSDSYTPAQIAMTQSGVCYAVDQKNIYRAIYPGAAWFVIADATDLSTQHASSTAAWVAIGVDPYSGALAAFSANTFSVASYMWYAADGINLQPTAAAVTNSNIRLSTLTFGDGVWRLSHVTGVSNTARMTTFNADCSSQIATASQGVIAAGFIHAGSETGTFYNLINSRYDDNDLTAPVAITYPAPTSYTSLQQVVGCDPTGQYVVYVVDATLYYSADYGANWSTATIPLGGNSDRTFCKVFSPTVWVISKRPTATGPTKIYYTDDAGANWTDATSELAFYTADARPSPSMCAGIFREPTT